MEAAPDFTNSKYFIANPEWHISADAPQELKDEFERWANKFHEQLEEDYPEIKDPYITWEGKVISRKKVKKRRPIEQSNICAPMQFRGPDLNEVICKDCMFREKDRLNGEIKGATLGTCECYPGCKPIAILFDHEDCDYYQCEYD